MLAGTMRRRVVFWAIGITAFFAVAVSLIHAATRDPGVEASLPPAVIHESGVTSTEPVRRGHEEAGSAPAGAARSASSPQPAGTSTRQLAGSPAPPTAAAIMIAFKLDPRLTRGLHMGTRWVSPARYVATRSGPLVTLQARAQSADAGRDATGAAWLASQPDMVALSPDHGREVEITVLREGESELVVTQGNAVTKLAVKAAREAGIWRVELSR
jgi:hypothetical protein